MIFDNPTFQFVARVLRSHIASFLIHSFPLLEKSSAASSGLISFPRKLEGKPKGFLGEMMEGRNWMEDS